jgi:hypothetical protein
LRHLRGNSLFSMEQGIFQNQQAMDGKFTAISKCISKAR